MPTVDRRTLTRTAVWSVPVIAVGASAPAMAASPVACPSFPGGAAFTVTKSADTNSAPATATGTSPNVLITMYTDSTKATATTVTATANLTVVPGNTYNFNFAVKTGLGTIAGSSTTFNASVVIAVGGATAASIKTKSTGPGTTLQQPTGDVTTGATVNYPYAYVAPAGVTSAAITFTFTISGGTNSGNNDDYQIRPTLTSCTEWPGPRFPPGFGHAVGGGFQPNGHSKNRGTSGARPHPAGWDGWCDH